MSGCCPQPCEESRRPAAGQKQLKPSFKSPTAIRSRTFSCPHQPVDSDAFLTKKIIFAIKELRNAVAHNGVVFDTRFARSKIDGSPSNCLEVQTGTKYKWQHACIRRMLSFNAPPSENCPYWLARASSGTPTALPSVRCLSLL